MSLKQKKINNNTTNLNIGDIYNLLTKKNPQGLYIALAAAGATGYAGYNIGKERVIQDLERLGRQDGTDDSGPALDVSRQDIQTLIRKWREGGIPSKLAYLYNQGRQRLGYDQNRNDGSATENE